MAKLWGEASHAVVEKALDALENLEHRGAEGADPNTGDGAGILMQIPDAFIRGAVAGIELPEPGRYGVGVCYLPSDPERRLIVEQLIEETIDAEGQRAIWWRDVPVDDRYVGETARLSAPVIRQVIVEASEEIEDQGAFERKLYVIRRVIERAAGPGVALPSFSSRTIVYKGMLTAPQLPRYFPDLRDPRVASRLALVHSRFSTNTFPSWELAHPYRMIAHNGEVNTLRGNVNWMRARESQLASELFGDDLEKVIPVVRDGGSDSAIFDNVLELLVLSGRTIPHALMMMVPEAYRTRTDLDPDVKGFYDFHSCLMEPWDGPAAVAFTDGRWAGAVLDRNGLRPGRWIQDTEGYVVLASETGVMTVAPEHIQRKGRLAPGKMFLVDLEEGRIVEDEEVKRRVARRKPYGEWYERSVVHINDLPEREPRAPRVEPLRSKQLAFGYSQEDLKLVIATMAAKGEEPVASMGNDSALAVLSERQPPLFTYFKQLFAQVTNPPIDPIRENVVMSLHTAVGAEVNLLSESPEQAHQLVMDQPILRNHELEKLRQVSHEIFDAATLDITWPIEDGADGMPARLDALCAEAERYVENGANILILSDRNLGPERVAMPSLLAVAAVHHHLVRAGTRLRTGLVIESGEPRDIHHMATLIGYGASAINPYVMFESLDELADRSLLPEDLEREEAEIRIVKAIGKGLLKTISKMGISTIQSYCGAQIFEAVGLDHELIDRHFTGTASRIGGVGLHVLATEALERHFRAYPRTGRDLLPVGGVLQWRRDGELHIWNPDTIASLQHAVGTVTRAGLAGAARAAGDLRRVRAPGQRRGHPPRGAARADEAARRPRQPMPLEEVEPATEIVKRFSTGAMSLGSPVARGPRDAGDRDEPARRQVQHRRGGRGPRPLPARRERRSAPVGDQAGRLRPVRGHDRLPRQRRPAPDQDGAGRQAGRGRAASRSQGRRLHRQDPQLDPRGGADLPAAAPRHLLDRGSQAAHLRPALRQPRRLGVGQARVRGRRRHRRRRGRQGQRRPRHDLRPRRGHRRLAAVLDPVRRRALGDRAGRDPADTAAQRPALTDHRRGRRPDQDRPRRRDRRAAGRRRVRLLDRAADRDGLHHDAGLPPEHLPGRDRDPGSGAARALPRHP